MKRPSPPGSGIKLPPHLAAAFSERPRRALLVCSRACPNRVHSLPSPACPTHAALPCPVSCLAVRKCAHARLDARPESRPNLHRISKGEAAAGRRAAGHHDAQRVLATSPASPRHAVGGVISCCLSSILRSLLAPPPHEQFMDRFLDSPVRTEDPSAAHMFFIPAMNYAYSGKRPGPACGVARVPAVQPERALAACGPSGAVPVSRVPRHDCLRCSLQGTWALPMSTSAPLLTTSSTHTRTGTAPAAGTISVSSEPHRTRAGRARLCCVGVDAACCPAGRRAGRQGALSPTPSAANHAVPDPPSWPGALFNTAVWMTNDRGACYLSGEALDAVKIVHFGSSATPDNHGTLPPWGHRSEQGGPSMGLP